MRGPLGRGLLTVFVLALTVPVVGAAEPSDVDIAVAVRAELKVEPAVSAENIDVDVQKGIATLDGEVANVLAKRRAARIAMTVRGVVSVVNTTRVPASKTRPPGEITEDIADAIAAAPVGQTYRVRVEATDDGVVMLEGAVRSWAERRKREENRRRGARRTRARVEEV